MSRFNWTWDVRRDGPHYFLELLFGEEDTPVLQQKAKCLLKQGFRWSYSSGEFESWMTPDSSEWNYLEIALAARRLFVTRGWGYSGRTTNADNDFLEALLEDGELSLQRWRVQAGGEGYAQITIDSGMGLEELLAYCAGRKKQCSLKEVETTLRMLLNVPEMRSLYLLGERVQASSSLTWPVQFVVPMLCRGWEHEGYRAELLLHSRNFERLAEELCDLCHVRTSKSGFAVEKETQLMRGGTINVNLSAV